jgi:magnesium chelatase family protein
LLSKVWTSTTLGVDAIPVIIETDVRAGLPKYRVVGLPHGAVRESLDRIWAALRNAGLPSPRGHVTINLAPADMRKDSASFDLPIAVGMMAASELLIEQVVLDDLYILGELALDGSVREVTGVLPMAIEAKRSGRRGVIVPAGNAGEATIVDGLEVFAVRSILEAFELLIGSGGPSPSRSSAVDLLTDGQEYSVDFNDVRGQEAVKRGLEVAAAGGHNVLLVGPPGAGKTMLARRMPTILPPLTLEEALETTKIHSVGGLLRGGRGLVAARPFRAPHHTISDAGLCGGGAIPRPGEISLSHNGVLFLDELPEFKRQVLEVLRQPMEEGAITISRSQCTVQYPARFILLASMNPCPCGYLNDPTRECTCSPALVHRYIGKISGPLMDRIDLHIEVTPVPFEELSLPRAAEPSGVVRDRVARARKIQLRRFGRRPGRSNAQMSSRAVQDHCLLDERGLGVMRTAIHRLGLSARAYDRILKVARTIADLDECDRIGVQHLSEAIQYRSLDRTGFDGY